MVVLRSFLIFGSSLSRRCSGTYQRLRFEGSSRSSDTKNRSPETAPYGKRAAAGCCIAHTHIHNAASGLPPFILSCFGFFGISAPSQYIATGHHSIDQTLSFATRFRKMDYQSYPCQKQLPKEHGGCLCSNYSSNNSFTLHCTAYSTSASRLGFR